ncbi:MAG: hypothetical protein AAF639_16450, partial [Chloroflexota bacterium]
MEFEEMQVIWNSEKQEKLYVINEDALYERIKRKGKSVNHWVNFFEWVMIGVNLAAGILLTVDSYRDQDPLLQYMLPVIYLAFSLGVLVFRITRRKEEVRFEESMLGELDKALWRLDYLIKQSRWVTLWYTLPLCLVFGAMTIFFDRDLVWATLLLLVVMPLSYFGSLWEVNKWYLPKKRDLQSLREKI